MCDGIGPTVFVLVLNVLSLSPGALYRTRGLIKRIHPLAAVLWIE
jgi:hypothetical protein